MEEKILNIIKNQNGKLTFKTLTRLINIGSNELKEMLLKMKLDGKILQNGNKYYLFPENLFLGSITISSTGKKYIFYNKL